MRKTDLFPQIKNANLKCHKKQTALTITIRILYGIYLKAETGRNNQEKIF